MDSASLPSVYCSLRPFGAHLWLSQPCEIFPRHPERTVRADPAAAAAAASARTSAVPSSATGAAAWISRLLSDVVMLVLDPPVALFMTDLRPWIRNGLPDFTIYGRRGLPVHR